MDFRTRRKFRFTVARSAFGYQELLSTTRSRADGAIREREAQSRASLSRRKWKAGSNCKCADGILQFLTILVNLVKFRFGIKYQSCPDTETGPWPDRSVRAWPPWRFRHMAKWPGRMTNRHSDPAFLFWRMNAYWPFGPFEQIAAADPP